MFSDYSQTLTQFIFDLNREQTRLSSELVEIIATLVLGVKLANKLVSRASLPYDTSENIFSDSSSSREVLLSNLNLNVQDVFLKLFTNSGNFSLVLSEQENSVHANVIGHSATEYIIAVAPLDGLSNFGTSVPVGSIFSIYSKLDQNQPPSINDFKQSPEKLVASAYAIYGSKTSFVCSIGQGIQGFTLDRSIGEFMLTDKNMRFPKSAKWVSVNESYESDWKIKNINNYLKKVKEQKSSAKNKLLSRYVGSLVVDFDRNLREGGILLHPSNEVFPSGRLSLLFQCIPLAFLAREAGGIATNGKVDILDISPKDVNQKSELYIGNKEEVESFLGS